jgi:hypothetical protein
MGRIVHVEIEAIWSYVRATVDNENPNAGSGDT